MRMLLWENLRLGPAADDDVLFCPSFSRPVYTRAKTVVTVYEATLALYPQYFPRNHFFEESATLSSQLGVECDLRVQKP